MGSLRESEDRPVSRLLLQMACVPSYIVGIATTSIYSQKLGAWEFVVIFIWLTLVLNVVLLYVERPIGNKYARLVAVAATPLVLIFLVHFL